MQTEKKFLHDRQVLLLLTVNSFLTALCGLLILLRLDSRVNGYIVEFRGSGGIDDFKTGGTSSLIAFIIFAIMVLGLNTILGLRAYQFNRHFGVGILALGTLLIVLAIIVSNALLVLR